jgi:hypothetical protein
MTIIFSNYSNLVCREWRHLRGRISKQTCRRKRTNEHEQTKVIHKQAPFVGFQQANFLPNFWVLSNENFSLLDARMFFDTLLN